MANYVILDEALGDLRQIEEFTVRNWGARQARIYLTELKAVFKFLAARPSIGRDRSEDVGAGYMSFPHKSHVVYYKKIETGVAIASVLHQNMLPEKHLKKMTGE